MKVLNYLIMLSLVISISACASVAETNSSERYSPTAQELETADYGAPPENYKKTIEAYMQRRLKDPESAKYRFTKPPIKSHISASSLEDTVFHYTVTGVFINAKNSYGGYTGENEYFFHIRNGVVTECRNLTKIRELDISNSNC